jgi:hypothetical protein
MPMTRQTSRNVRPTPRTTGNTQPQRRVNSFWWFLHGSLCVSERMFALRLTILSVILADIPVWESPIEMNIARSSGRGAIYPGDCACCVHLMSIWRCEYLLEFWRPRCVLDSCHSTMFPRFEIVLAYTPNVSRASECGRGGAVV